MAPESAAPVVEKRFNSDQLMLELGRGLAEKGRISRAQFDELNARRALTGDALDRLLIREGVVPEEEVLKTLSDLSGIPFHHIADFTIAPEAVRKVQPRVALRYKTMPLKIDGGVITLAVSEVPTLAMTDSLRMLLDLAIDWVLCSDIDVTKSIKHFYGLGAEAIDDLVAASAGKEL
jgi:hypothetical protein